MPIYSNSYSEWFTDVITPSGRVVYLCLDNPYMIRPAGVTDFIGVQIEPNAILGLRDAFIANSHKFDTLLVYDDTILKSCSNARLIFSGTTRIPEDVYNCVDLSLKQDKISCLTGIKRFAPGHLFRTLLYNSQLQINLPITWYRSGHQPPPDINNNPMIPAELSAKKELFLKYNFSLVIENSREPNFFSEKLIDCLLMKTIPIYYGCTNINTWFNTTGWIFLDTETVEELVNKCKILPDFNALIPVINDNHERAKKYSSISKNILDGLFKHT